MTECEWTAAASVVYVYTRGSVASVMKLWMDALLHSPLNVTTSLPLWEPDHVRTNTLIRRPIDHVASYQAEDVDAGDLQAVLGSNRRVDSVCDRLELRCLSAVEKRNRLRRLFTREQAEDERADILFGMAFRGRCVNSVIN